MSDRSDRAGLTPAPDSPPLQRRAVMRRRTLVGVGAAALLVGCPSSNQGRPPHPGPPPQIPPDKNRPPQVAPVEDVDAPHSAPEPQPLQPADDPPAKAPQPAPEPESRHDSPPDAPPSSAQGPAPDKPLVPPMQGTPPAAKPVFGSADPEPM